MCDNFGAAHNVIHVSLRIIYELKIDRQSKELSEIFQLNIKVVINVPELDKNSIQ